MKLVLMYEGYVQLPKKIWKVMFSIVYLHQIMCYNANTFHHTHASWRKARHFQIFVGNLVGDETMELQRNSPTSFPDQ